MDQLTEEEINELKEVFSQFDKGETLSIPAKDLGLVIRQLFTDEKYHLSEQDIQEMINEVNPDGSENIEFPEFLSLIARKKKDTDTKEELIEAFKVFDKEGSKIIQSKELRYALKTYGSVLTDEEIDELIKEADKNGDGNILYENFVEDITAIK